MLQHAIVTANQFGENTEITLLVFYDRKNSSGIGSIGHMAEFAAMSGIKVKMLELKGWKEDKSNDFDPESPNPDSPKPENKPDPKAGKKNSSNSHTQTDLAPNSRTHS
jgi:hypothetical protein